MICQPAVYLKNQLSHHTLTCSGDTKGDLSEIYFFLIQARIASSWYSEWITLLTFTFVGRLVQDCLCGLNFAIPGHTRKHRWKHHTLCVVLFSLFLIYWNNNAHGDKRNWSQLQVQQLWLPTKVKPWATVWAHTHTPYILNASLTSPFRPCCYEKRFHFCFVLANTIGSMNKTQANRTQTAAAAGGCMGKYLSPYVCDSEEREETKLH